MSKVGIMTNDRPKLTLIESIKAISSGNVYPLLPLLATILPNVAMLTSYLVGINSRPRRINYLPYPSDLGESQPERGFFTLSLGLNACLVFACVFVRYLQLDGIILPEYRRVNIYTAGCGMFAVVGQCLVFSFSYKEDPAGHYLGAFFFFTLNTMYMTMQTAISLKLPQFHPKLLVFIRFVCSMFGVFAILLYTFGRIFAPKRRRRDYLPQSAEWILGSALVVFFFTFVYDFNGLWCVSENQFYEMPHHNQKATEFIEHLQKKINERKEERNEEDTLTCVAE